MKEKTDRRIRKTKAQLRAGLAKLMQEKSIKEIAIENFKFNMKNYLNSKVIRYIKKKFPAFLEGLIFALLQNLIFNAIGMH